MKARTGVVVFFLFWLFLEGILRKWIAPGLSTPIFFVKYLLALTYTLHFLLDRQQSFRPNPYALPIAFYVTLLLFGGLTSAVLFSPIVSVIGLLVYVGFVFLIWAIPEAIRDRAAFNRFVVLFSFILIASYLLGVVQYFSPADAFINKYAREMANIATVGDKVRITSVFSYIGPLQVLVIFSNVLLLSLFINLKSFSRSNFLLLVVVAAFILSILNSLMTGSRGAVGWSVILMVLYLMSGFIMGTASGKVIVRLILIVSVVGFALMFTGEGSTALDNFVGRVESTNDIETRVLDSFDPFKFLAGAGALGYGVGSTYQGASQFITYRYDMPGFWEEESERILLEVGGFGFVLIFLLRIYLFYLSYTLIRDIRTKDLRSVALVFLVVQVPTVLMLDQSIFNWMSNVIYWATMGFIVAFKKIDKQLLNE